MNFRENIWEYTDNALEIPDKVLEIGGHDMLTHTPESWNKLKKDLKYPVDMVLLRCHQPAQSERQDLK